MMYPHLLTEELMRRRELEVERHLRRSHRGMFHLPRQRRSIGRIYDKEAL